MLSSSKHNQQVKCKSSFTEEERITTWSRRYVHYLRYPSIKTTAICKLYRLLSTRHLLGKKIKCYGTRCYKVLH